jgi:hypothetical protein
VAIEHHFVPADKKNALLNAFDRHKLLAGRFFLGHGFPVSFNPTALDQYVKTWTSQILSSKANPALHSRVRKNPELLLPHAPVAIGIHGPGWRDTGATKEEAERKALERATELLARTRRHAG